MKKTELSNASFYIAGGVTIFLSSIILFIIFFNGFLKNNEKTEYVDAYKVNISIIKGKKYAPVYQPTYYYEVNGINYKYTPLASTFLNLEDIMANRLYYNPTDPTDVMAIYETKISAEQWLSLYYSVMFFVCSIILIIIGTNQAISLKRLQKNGLLIKGLPCEILPRGFSGLKNLYMVEVEYRLPSGEKLTFSKNIPPTYSEDTTISRFADLLIDPENPQVYVLYVKN